jgi:hypothetical protein
MRKLGIAVLGAVSLTLLTAVSAFAQDNGSPVGPGEEGVLPEVVVRGAPGGVAFAGSEVTVWMVLAALLFAVGVAFLVAARRRARASGN